ncbi:3471_t:CDS:10 [Funneliformis mosseae]|uniref:3471_t:CDS:1 n=1 Tax=Funneliformis mosseae TaxID=27381 RepID=A0A9N9CYU4_FUNMO|nr:3471_t:CDS:10 [Funneliformis mosseae]
MSTAAFQTETLPLDASLFEGGGQVIRICIGLRAKREDPGLKPQHVSGLKLVQNIFQADLQGGIARSKEIYFKPNEVNNSINTFIADTQTAGITLLIQISLPPLLFSAPPPKSKLFLPPRSKKVILKGGSAVNAAPPIDFLTEIFKPIVEREFGLNFDVSIIRRGYYPRGGGEVELRVDPIVEKSLKPSNLVERGKIVKFGKQIVESATKILTEAALFELESIQFDIEINTERYNTCKGSDILLWAETSSGCLISGHALSDKKRSPEEIGRRAAEELIRNIKHGGCVDEYLQDQLIMFMALAEGKSNLVSGPITSHTRAAIHFVEVMSGVKFCIKKLDSFESNVQGDKSEDGNLYLIECEGIGLKISKQL